MTQGYRLPGRQHGATMWMIIAVMALVVMFALVVMKLTPAYLENAKVMNALERLAEDPRAATMPRAELIQKISDTLYIDMANDLLDLREAVVITKSAGKRTVEINYERVIPMVYNISALLDFENSVDIPTK